MGILQNTVSLCQFTVTGDLPAGDLYPWVAERLARHPFAPIDTTAAEQSVGWTQGGEPRQWDFSAPRACWRDHYLFLTLRRDRRLLPAALVRGRLQEAEEEFLAATPGFRRVPRQKREELREAVRGFLLARTLPVPANWDAVWDTRSGVLTLATLGTKTVELFEEEFKKTFPGLRLQAIHPYARAQRVVSEGLRPALEQANRATSTAALDLIQANRWLGEELLLWLLHGSLEGAGRYRVNQPGPADAGETFAAWLDDRLVLAASGEAGVQKVTVTGPQSRFSEVRAALRGGKRIIDATLHLERGEDAWRLTLKGELFQFGSLRCPAVRIERDDSAAAEHEVEAVFFERMHLLETGLQLFDSLYASFLGERLGSGWGMREAEIQRWLEAGGDPE